MPNGKRVCDWQACPIDADSFKRQASQEYEAARRMDRMTSRGVPGTAKEPLSARMHSEIDQFQPKTSCVVSRNATLVLSAQNVE